jgi:hypothetical protein
MKPKAAHTNFKKGKCLRIVLRNGLVVVAKFLESHERFIVVDSGKYLKSDLKSVSIFKL